MNLLTDKLRERIAEEIQVGMARLVDEDGRCDDCNDCVNTINVDTDLESATCAFNNKLVSENFLCPADVAFSETKARHILAIPEIKEGQELREKAKGGKLVELDENQSWPSDPFYPIDTFRIRNYNQLCENSGFRRVKVKNGSASANITSETTTKRASTPIACSISIIPSP